MRVIALLLSLLLLSCSSHDDLSRLRVGTVSGPETDLMKVAQKVALEQSGLDIQIMTFADYILPNTALVDGSLDANVFQHEVYLEHYLKAHPNAHLIAVAKTFVYPMGIYSQHYTLQTLPDKAKVAIPNDPSNNARALLLLEKAKLITLKHKDIYSVTIADIENNPKQLEIIALEAAQLPRVLPDVGLAVINTNYSLMGGLLPSRDALLTEDQHSPYANVVVVRQGFEKDARVKALVEALHSQAVLEKAEELFQGQAIPAR